MYWIQEYRRRVEAKGSKRRFSETSAAMKQAGRGAPAKGGRVQQLARFIGQWSRWVWAFEVPPYRKRRQFSKSIVRFSARCLSNASGRYRPHVSATAVQTAAGDRHNDAKIRHIHWSIRAGLQRTPKIGQQGSARSDPLHDEVATEWDFSSTTTENSFPASCCLALNEARYLLAGCSCTLSQHPSMQILSLPSMRKPKTWTTLRNLQPFFVSSLIECGRRVRTQILSQNSDFRPPGRTASKAMPHGGLGEPPRRLGCNSAFPVLASVNRKALLPAATDE